MKAIENRRSIYGISKEEIVTREEVKTIVSDCLKHSPSAFNSQPHRALLLFGEESDALWELVATALKNKLGDEGYLQTEGKIKGFQSGYGTMIPFIDRAVVTDLAERFPPYAATFGPWAEQSIGMFQFAVWTALEAKGLGVNLQHYSNLIEQAVRERYDLPASWEMIAQIPFGKKVAEAGEKQYPDLNQCLIVKGA